MNGGPFAGRRPGGGMDGFGFLPPLPQPVGGCEECRRLAQLRQQARETCDRSRVTDMNVLLRRHHFEAHP